MIEFRSKLDSSKTTALTKRSFKRLLWLFVLLSCVMIAVGAVGIAFAQDDSDLGYGVGLIVFGVLITPLGYLLSRVLQKGNDRSTIYISSDTEEVYTFDEQFLTVTQTKGDEFYSTARARYSYIYKAYEDKNYYYLYISKMQSHVIEKSSITKGTLEELDLLLKRNLGERFKSK